MSAPSPKDPPPPAPEPSGEKASRVRQRQRLIEACISALYAYGPSRTTVEKVVSIANLSPGIVNFYFDSKAAMMVAALEFLAGEFEREVLEPVIQIRADPVRALELLVDLYLDPEIASPRKVSVWFAFWGEANSRQEYYDICGKRDEAFAALVQDLIQRLIVAANEPHLEADGVALGLIGALDTLWQNFAFEIEANIDRVDAKRRCKGFLRSVFPRQFGPDRAAIRPGQDRPRPRAALAGASAPGRPLPAPGDFAAECRDLFLEGWQFVGHVGEIPHNGDFIAAEMLGERALILREPKGALRAFRNACGRQPHALSTDRLGHFGRGPLCPVDGAAYGHDGRPRGRQAQAALTPLAVTAVDGLIFVRFAPASAEPPPLPGLVLPTPAGSARTAAAEFPVAADWTVVVEHWLDTGFAGDAAAIGNTLEATADGLLWQGRLDSATGGPWSARHYAKLADRMAGERGAPLCLVRRLVFPNLRLERRPDGVTILQAAPLAPGRAAVRRFEYGVEAAEPIAGALGYLGQRLVDRRLADDLRIMASTQAGLASRFHDPDREPEPGPAVRAFRTWLSRRRAAHGAL